MSGARSVAVYEACLRAYPRAFRDEYGPDMVLLFRHQLHDEPVSRVWARGVVDLALTVPALHLESSMSRQPNPVVAVCFAVIALTGAFLAVVGGSNVGTFVVGLAVMALAGGLAVVAWRRARPVAAALPVAAQWWKFFVGGAAVLAAVIVGTTMSGELSSNAWLPVMLVGLASVLAVAAGIVLGVRHLMDGRPRDLAG